MGFSIAYWQELQIHLDRIRFGNRVPLRERLDVPYQGIRPDRPAQTERPPRKDRSTPPTGPGYDRFKLRLW